MSTNPDPESRQDEERQPGDWRLPAAAPIRRIDGGTQLTLLARKPPQTA